MAHKTNLKAERHCMVVFAHYPAGETRVQRQAEALIEQGFEVDIICLRSTRIKDQKATEMINGAQVYRMATSRTYSDVGFMRQLYEYMIFFVQAMFALISLHPQRHYGVVQIHNLPDFLIFCGWFPKLFGARLILDIHDLMPEFFVARTEKDIHHWVVRLIVWQEKLSCLFADHVITVTELWRETLIERGVPPNKVSVVMNVADDRIFQRNSKAIEAVPKDGPLRLFYHGAIVPRYGLDLVLEAMAQLKDELPDLSFTLHGGHKYRLTLAQQAKELDIEDRVHFSTQMKLIEELPQLIFDHADVAVVPYRRDIFTDGILPTKLMEYTALGIPSIVARTSAIGHYFDDTMVEFFTPEDVDSLVEAIRRVYHDRERLVSLVEQSDKFNQRYHWAKISADYIASLRRLKGPKLIDKKEVDNWQEFWEIMALNQDPVAATDRPTVSMNEYQTYCQDIEQKLEIDSTDVVLEIGCGTGLMSAYLSPYVKQIVATDYAFNMTVATQDNTKGLENLYTTTCAGEATPFQANTFSKVFLYAVTQYLSEEQFSAILQELKRITQPGGLILFGEIPRGRDERLTQRIKDIWVHEGPKGLFKKIRTRATEAALIRLGRYTTFKTYIRPTSPPTWHPYPEQLVALTHQAGLKSKVLAQSKDLPWFHQTFDLLIKNE